MLSEVWPCWQQHHTSTNWLFIEVHISWRSFGRYDQQHTYCRRVRPSVLVVPVLSLSAFYRLSIWALLCPVRGPVLTVQQWELSLLCYVSTVWLDVRFWFLGLASLGPLRLHSVYQFNRENSCIPSGARPFGNCFSRGSSPNVSDAFLAVAGRNTQTESPGWKLEVADRHVEMILAPVPNDLKGLVKSCTHEQQSM